MKHQGQILNLIYFIIMVLLLSIATFNVFYKLGEFPIYSWDEARHGVSAYEMLQNHNFIVNTYRNRIDYWNLKPPLSFWMIILGYKIVGFNALGLRFFSAIFYLLTISLVGIFVYKKFGKIAALVTILVLSTCSQILINHSSRTGDADSLFVFLFTVAILSLLQFHTNHKWWIYVSGLSFSLAFLTKSWHAGNIVIIMGLYLLITGDYKKLSFRNWGLLALSMLLPILIWASFRYQYDGINFFKKMVEYDLLQRSSSSIEGHVGGVLYYVHILIKFFAYWIFLLCLTGTLLFFKRGFLTKSIKLMKHRSMMIGIGLWVLIPFLLFTMAKTKVRWYILPIYPPIAIIIGVLTSKILLKRNWLHKAILMISIVSVSLFYEIQISSYVNHPIQNLKQSLIEKITDNKKVKNDRLFIYHVTGNAIWLQSEVLTAELSDDLHVNNGDFSDFLKTSKSILLIPTNLFSEKLIQSSKLKVIVNNSWGYLVEKQS